MENISDDLGEKIIFQLRELIRFLEIKLGKQEGLLVNLSKENGSK